MSHKTFINKVKLYSLIILKHLYIAAVFVHKSLLKKREDI